MASPSASIAAKCSESPLSKDRARRSCSIASRASGEPTPERCGRKGASLKLRHPADAIRAGLVLVPANRLVSLLPQRSVQENVALAAFGRLRNWGPIPMGEERRRVDMAVRKLQIDTRAAAEVRRLSGGNMQKVVIARWIAAGFKTLLCFDPTRGIDIGTKQQIYALMREIADPGPVGPACSPRNCRRFALPAIGRSFCSAVASRAKCLRRKRTKRAS